MKRLIISLLFIGLLLACQENEPTTEFVDAENLTSKQIDSILTEFKFDYESPIILDSSKHILIPISTELLIAKVRSSYSSYRSNYKNPPRYWNVLFYDREIGVTRLLTEEKIRISEIYANKQLQEQYEINNQYLDGKVLYSITDMDYNQDKELNSKDPEYLFSSNPNGSNLERISPISEDLQYFRVVSDSDEILIRTLRDVNQDSIFDRKDESIWYRADLLNQTWRVEEMIDSTGRKQIENLYFEQWLKKK